MTLMNMDMPATANSGTSLAERLGGINKIIHTALANGQTEVFDSACTFYHYGLYTNDCSLWSHTPDHTPCPEELSHTLNFFICARPREQIKLLTLSQPDFYKCCTLSAPETLQRRHAMHSLSQLLGQHSLNLQIDGIAATILEEPGRYRDIILLRPLESLQLQDIEAYRQT